MNVKSMPELEILLESEIHPPHIQLHVVELQFIQYIGQIGKFLIVPCHIK